MTPKAMTIMHKGEPCKLPFIVHHGSSVTIYSLLDFETACRLCEKENYKPTVIRTPEGEKKAAGFVAANDNIKTSLTPYLEWSLGIFVNPRSQEPPEVDYINETSLFFQSILDNDVVGNRIYCPKLILNEILPTEIGFEYYGIPKERGEIKYQYDRTISEFSVSPEQGPWIMKASFPKKRGVLSKFGLLGAMFKAFNFRLVLQSFGKKEFTATLIGSKEINAKMAEMKIKKDPKTEMFSWKNQDCQMEFNPESEWGKVLIDLKFQPELVCHVPNLNYEFSEPLDQI